MSARAPLLASDRAATSLGANRRGTSRNVTRAEPKSVAVTRLEARRERIMEEGKRLFLAKGYAGASVNEIVRRAGGSLATLYSEFGSKEALFAQIMRRRAHVMYGWNGADCLQHKTQREALHALAKRLLDRMLEAESLALYRIAISEGPRFPELRKAVLDDSFPLFLHSLSDALVALRVATPKDGGVLAEEFLSLVHGQLVFRAACGSVESLSAKARAVHIERVVDGFLALHRPRLRHRG